MQLFGQGAFEGSDGKDDTPRGQSSSPKAAFSASTPGRSSNLRSPQDLPRKKSGMGSIAPGKRASLAPQTPAVAKRELDEEEIQRLDGCFAKFDKDNSGSITYKVTGPSRMPVTLPPPQLLP